MLRVRELEAFYGASQALFGMELGVDAGEVVTLMGRNGMGKTTTVNTIMGLLPARRGVVEFEGQRVDHLPSYPHRPARAGPGARGPADLPQPLGAREPGRGRGQPRAATPRPGPWPAPSTSSRGSPSASATWATSSRAASSRCWRSAAR